MNSSGTETLSGELTAVSYRVPSLASLFLSFLRLGSTSFGGPSMVAYIRHMAVEKKHWMDEGSFLEGVALCQIIPGATAMQTAAYVGIRTRGLIGSTVAFIGFGLPAFILMMVFSALYSRTHSLSAVLSAFKGLQAIIVAIMANSTLTFGRTTLKDWKGAITALLAAGMFGWGVNPILAILFSMLLGVLLKIDAAALKSRSSQAIPNSNTGLWIVLAVACAAYIALFLIRRELFEVAAMMSLINLFSFGGGFAAIPLMFHEVVDVYKWLDAPTFLNGIVLGQITPGPIVITATFIGCLSQGFWGGVVATAGMFLPSFLMVAWTASYFGKLLAFSHFTAASGGTLCSFVGLLLMVTMRFGIGVHWNLACVCLALGAFFALHFKIDILWVVLAGTVISVAVL